MSKPGQVSAIAIATLVSGCLNLLWALSLIPILLFGGAYITICTCGIGAFFILPFFLLPVLAIVVGIFEVVYATKILPDPIKTNKPSHVVAIMEICCILTGNIIALAVGILALVFYGDNMVKAYFAAQLPS